MAPHPITDEERRRNALAEANLPLAYWVARRHRPGGRLDIRERTAAALEALVDAAARFDPARGARFATYAVRLMRQRIARAAWEDRAIRLPPHLRRALRRPAADDPAPRASGRGSGATIAAARRALATERAAPGLLDDLPAAPAGADGDDRALARLGQAMDRLPDRERRVLRGLYWEGLTQAQLGAELGYTRARIGQIARDVLARLRRELD